MVDREKLQRAAAAVRALGPDSWQPVVGREPALSLVQQEFATLIQRIAGSLIAAAPGASASAIVPSDNSTGHSRTKDHSGQVIGEVVP